MGESMENTLHLKSDQRGLVAIFSVMIIMGILTLLTIGFSTITRQAQRRSLDDVLNTQAFYAAEAGVNGAIHYINGAANINATSECDELDNPSIVEYSLVADNIAVSCLLINPSPSDLEFSNVPIAGDPKGPVVGDMNGNTTNINRMRFEWDAVEQDRPISTINDNTGFLPKANWGTGVGIVRIDLVPAASNDRGNSVNDSYSFYLYPTSGNAGPSPGNLSAGPNAHGDIHKVQCSNNNSLKYRCDTTLVIAPPQTHYYLRAYSYYNPVSLRITPLSGNTPVPLYGSQAIIDSTGRANDVYRRIQVRYPLFKGVEGFNDVFSIFSGETMCKRYVGAPGETVTRPPASVSSTNCDIQ